jgi:hypothetical protein
MLLWTHIRLPLALMNKKLYFSKRRVVAV